MKKREKIILIAGGLVLAGFFGFRLLRSGAGASSASNIRASVTRIQEADRLRRSVQGLITELAISVPRISTVEQESQIRQELGRRTQENKLVVVSMTRIESSGRGRTSASVQSIEYLLDLYGRYDDFMKLITDLERASTPYVVRNIKFDNSPRTPGEQGQGGPDQQNSDMVKLPGGETVSLSSLSGAARDRAEAYMRSRSRGGPEGGGKKDQPNGRVHATLRVLSYLFPPDLGQPRTQTANAPRNAPTPGMGQSANAAQHAPAAAAGTK